MFELLIALLVYVAALLGGLLLFTKEDWRDGVGSIALGKDPIDSILDDAVAFAGSRFEPPAGRAPSAWLAPETHYPLGEEIA
jgi:hypothetical protein